MAQLIDLSASVDQVSSTRGGQTTLTCMCRWNNLQGVQLLLASQADPNRHNENGHHPLHMISKTQVLEIAVALLDAGADPILPIKNTQITPLTQAEFYSNQPLIDILRSAAARHEANKALMEIDRSGPGSGRHETMAV